MDVNVTIPNLPVHLQNTQGNNPIMSKKPTISRVPVTTPDNWRDGIVAILSNTGRTVGTGFVVSEDGLIATCAHVVSDHVGIGPGDRVKVRFAVNGEEALATVTAWWREKIAEDVAILSLLVERPEESFVLPLVSAHGSEHHPFTTFGYHLTAKIEAIIGDGTIRGLVSEQGVARLQLYAHEISHGFSGAPVWDKTLGGVVGIIQQGAKPDPQRRLLETSFATPSDTLVAICPSLQLSLCGPVLTQTRQRHDFYPHKDLPANYLARSELLADVRHALLSNSARRILLHGMGGVGKTVLLRSLCEDPVVQVAFPDGILWATLGEKVTETDLYRNLRDWINALSGESTDPLLSLNSLKNKLANLLHELTCLLVLDDVWRQSDVAWFLVNAPHCCFLLTSREASIIEATTYPVPVMTHSEATSLLAAWAHQPLDSHYTAKIVERLGYLPLALKLAGSQLRMQVPAKWLSTFHAQKLISKRQETVHDNLYDTFAVSLNNLTTDTHALYLALAIFKGNEPMPIVAIIRLWEAIGHLTPEEVKERLYDLDDRALLQLNSSDSTISLHNLLHDYITDELGKVGYITTHQALLDVYRQTQTGDGWFSAVDDGYLYSHLIYHLEKAGLSEEIHNLFSTSGWSNRRHLRGLLDDFAAGWALINKYDRPNLAYLVRYALFNDVLQRGYKKLPVELMLLLIVEGVIPRDLFMPTIRSLESDNSSKVKTYLEIVFSHPEVFQQYASDVLEIAAEITEAEERASLTLDLHRYLPEYAKPYAHRIVWQATFKIKSRKNRLGLFDKMFPMPRDLCQELREEALQIENLYRRMYIIEEILPYLNLAPEIEQEIWRYLLETVKTPSRFDNYNKADLFVELLPMLPQSIQAEAGEAAWDALDSNPYWEPKEFFLNIFDPLVPYLPSSCRIAAWEKAYTKKCADEKYWCERAMASILPHLPEEYIINTVLKLKIETHSLENQRAFAEILVVLGNYAPPAQRQDLQSIAFNVVSKWMSDRGWVVSIAGSFNEGILWQAWQDTAEQIERGGLDVTSYIHFLQDLAMGVPPTKISEACAICFRLQSSAFHSDRRAEVLKRLIERTPLAERESLWREVLHYSLESNSLFRVPLTFAIDVIDRMPSALQQEVWPMVHAKIRDLALNEQLYCFVQAMKFLPGEQQPAIWLEAWGVAVTASSNDGDLYRLCHIIEQLPTVYKYVIDENSSVFQTLDWNAAFWYELYSRSSRPIQKPWAGLILLQLHAPEWFIKKLWDKHQQEEKDAPFWLISGLAYPPSIQMETLVPQLTENNYGDEIFNYAIATWPKNVACKVWEEILNLNRLSPHYFWKYVPFAPKLVPHLPLDFTIQAWKSMFDNSFIEWGEIRGLLTHRIPREDVVSAWQFLDEMDGEQGRDIFHDSRNLKSILAKRFPEVVFTSCVKTEMPRRESAEDLRLEQIFLCTFGTYLRQYLTDFSDDYLDEAEGSLIKQLLLKVFIYLWSFIGYFFIPLFYLILKIPGVLRLNAILSLTETSDNGTLKRRQNRFWDISYRINKVTFGIYNALLILFVAPFYLVGGLLHSYWVLAIQYALPPSEAERKIVKELLKGEVSTKALAKARPLIWAAGGAKLEYEVATANSDAWDWWIKCAFRSSV